MNKKSLLIFILCSTSFLFQQDEIDCAGISDGNTVCLNFGEIIESTGSLNIYYESEDPIFGFQFSLFGLEIIDAQSDVFDQLIFNQSNILGVSLSGQFLPPGSGVLVSLTVIAETDITICINDAVIGGESGINLPVNIGECIEILASPQDCIGVYFGEALIDDCGECSGGTTDHVANSSDVGCGCFSEEAQLFWYDQDADGLGDPAESTYYCSEIGTITPNTLYELVPIDWVTNDSDLCPLDPLNDEDNDTVCGDENGYDLCPGFDDLLDFDFDGIPDNCDNTEWGDVHLSFGVIDTINTSLELIYDSNVEIFGFQITISGALISDGENDIFDISTNDSIALGVNLSGESLPPGTGTLVTLFFNEGYDSLICITNAIVGGYDGNELGTTYNNCTSMDWEYEDCAGIYNGDAIIDDCGVCAGGTTGLLPNNIESCIGPDLDCNCDCGLAFIDDCGVCSGGDSGHVPNSDMDECGICFGSGALTFYIDEDGDGLGNPDEGVVSCINPDGYVPNNDDECPNDFENDADDDGICGDLDICEGYDDNLDFDGDDIPDGCDIGMYGDVGLLFGEVTESPEGGVLEIEYSSNVDIYGFQFSIIGRTFISGVSDSSFIIDISPDNGNVIGVSLTGSYLNAGEGILVTLTFDHGDATDICINDAVFAGIDGNPLLVNYPIGNCIFIPATPQDCAGDYYGDAQILTYCYDMDGDGLGDPGSESDLCNGLVEGGWGFDCSDGCPFDADNDIDADGLCGDVDNCPNDQDNDLDNDGICGDVDECPSDPLNDNDEDGICGDENGNDLCNGFDDNLDFDEDGIPDDCDDTQWGDAFVLFGVVNGEDGLIEIIYESNINIFGFQLNIDGITITSANNNTFYVDFSNETGNILGIGFQGEYLPAGTGTLVDLTFDPGEDSTICISDVILGGEDATIIDVTVIQECVNRDCAGVYEGPNYVDNCGICDSDESNDGVTCVPPSSLNAIPSYDNGGNIIDISWESVTNALGYNVYYNNGEFIGFSSTNSFTDPQGTGFALEYSAEYCYIVKTINSLGIEGDATDEICVTTLPYVLAGLGLDVSQATDDGLIHITMVNLWYILGYQFDVNLSPGIVEVDATINGLLDTEYGENGNIIGFSLTGDAIPPNPDGTILVTLEVGDYVSPGDEMTVSIGNFIFSDLDFLPMNVCDLDFNPLNGCDVFATFETPEPDCNGIPAGSAILDDCGDCTEGLTGLIFNYNDPDGDTVCNEGANNGDADNCPNDANSDQWNYDGDTEGDVCDSDDDNDGALDEVDSDDNNEFVCNDDDGDTCDECSSGSYDSSNDGFDYDGDGLCDDGDPDDDNDGALDEVDSDDNNEFVCSFDDADNCDDCSNGFYDPGNDGFDYDGDGLCDDGDDCPMGDIELGYNSVTGTSINIEYDSNVDIYGFQFEINGVTLTGASSDLAEPNFNPENGIVIVFSLTGNFLPQGDGTLINLEFEPINGGGTISIIDSIFSGQDGNNLCGTLPDLEPIPGTGCTDSAAENYHPGNLFDDGSCEYTGSGSIGEYGGTVGSEDDGADVEIPLGTFDEDIEITVENTTETAPEIPDVLDSVSDVYSFEPFDLTFEEPVTITINYDGNGRQDLTFIYLEDDADTSWEEIIGGSFEFGEAILVINSFGIYTVIEDQCPSDIDNDIDGDGICGDVDTCPYDGENDIDEDGICGDVDACPYDGENDIDEDGICGDVDTCPYDGENDIDEDGICGDVDTCPYDGENDIDEDGICGDVDACPYDGENDADADDICGDVDPWPNCYDDGIDPYDCNDDCNGTAFFDNCEVCSGGNTDHDENSDIDCAGVCFGGSYFDVCSVCDDDPMNDNQSCYGCADPDAYNYDNSALADCELAPVDDDIDTSCCEYTTGFTIELVQLSNLISFWALPENGSVSNVMEPLGMIASGIIGEGIAAAQITPGNWVGNLSELSCSKGYWLKITEEPITLPIADALDCVDVTYELHEGANLISFPYAGIIGLSDGIPDSVEPFFIGVIGEGVGATNIGCDEEGNCVWYGSLVSWSGTKGYWVIIDNISDYENSYCLDDDNYGSSCDADCDDCGLEFTYIEPENNPIRGFTQSSSSPNFSIQETLTQSTEQAFYFVLDVELEHLEIDEGWLTAYCNDELVGARYWTGEPVDIPAMGNDGYEETSNYCEAGDIPEFKFYDEVSGETIDLAVENVPEWESNGLFILGNLTIFDAVLPSKITLAPAYPNPFNPVTTIDFGLPDQVDVSLSVFDMGGRLITELVNSNLPAGFHTYQWNADSYASGVYILRMNVGSEVITQKLLLMK